MFGRSAMPRLGTRRAESGKLSNCDRPTRRLPAPIANNSSVVVGLRETMRREDVAAGSGAPKSSRWTAAAGFDSFGLHAASASRTARTEKTYNQRSFTAEDAEGRSGDQ